MSLPSQGGDTGFANMQTAYAALPAYEQASLAALKTVNKIEDHDYVSAQDRAKFGAPQVHPLIRTHPATGKKALYVHPGKLERIEGMEPEESLAFVNGLLERVIQPAVTYQHKWRLGDVLLCDNRAVLHLAYHDYDHREGRVMHRAILEGEGRRAVLDDDASVGKVDVVGDLAGETHLMGDQDAGHSVLRQVADGHQHLLHRLRVEGRGHFVEQHDVRVHGQRAGDRDALLLAAGQFARIALLLARPGGPS